MYTKKSNLSILVFVITLLVSGISFTPILFPKLFLGIISDYPTSLDEIYEFGKHGLLLTTINLSLIFLLFLLNYKKISRLSRLQESLLKYDISRKKTILILIVIFTVYLSYSWDELFNEQEKIFADYREVLSGIPKVSLFTEQGNLNVYYLRYTLLKFSNDVLGNIRLLPFFSSCALLLFTYLFTKEISQKRLGGLVSLVVLLQSNLFLLFDNIATYETFWIMFYLVSIYLVLKKVRLSFIAFMASLFTKAVSFLFLPITLFLICSSKMSNKLKLQSIMIYTLPFIIFIFVGLSFHIFDTSSQIPPNPKDFWASLSSFATGTRFDGLVLSTFFPVIVCLYIRSKKYVDYSSFLLFSLSVLLVIPWILHPVLGFTNQPYRLIPFITFFAISFGALFGKQLIRSEQV